MTSLLRYDAARAALAEAKGIDEVKSILDWAARARLYAEQAGNTGMEADAIDIRERAERELGLLLLAQKETYGLARGGRPKTGPGNGPVSPPPITLSDLKIKKNLSSRAQKKASISAQAFEAMMGRQRERIIARGAVDVLKDVSTATKQERRANHERVLGAMQCSLPKRKYGVILADPEWRFEPWSRETGMDRAPDNHYPTSCTEVIAARDVPSIAARDCVLFLWATGPMMPHALVVMGAWGFDYKSQAIWRKSRIGTGYWFRSVHELLLVGTRGAIPAPAMGTQPESVIDAPSGEHSAKPEEVLKLIETWYPTIPKIELNRRGAARPGWDAWGNEVVDPETGEILEKSTEAA
jgi:N6-adenosine-specific RNA methylase IME4